MKRRSARPFVVEVKHSRTFGTPRSHDVERVRSGAVLRQTPFAWPHDDDRAEESAKPSVAMEEERLRIPERRILPSLMPMFAPQSDPKPEVAVAEPRLPRVPRPRKTPKPARGLIEAFSASPPEAPAIVEPPVAVEAVPAAVRADAVAELCSDARIARPERRSGRDARLPAGERWKRRLPRILR